MCAWTSWPSRPLLKDLQGGLGEGLERGRQEGDGTENVMTERPSHAHWFRP